MLTLPGLFGGQKASLVLYQMGQSAAGVHLARFEQGTWAKSLLRARLPPFSNSSGQARWVPGSFASVGCGLHVTILLR